MAMAARIAKSVLGWLPVIAVVLAIQLVANRGVIDAGRAPDLRGQIVGGESFAGLETMPKPAKVNFWASNNAQIQLGYLRVGTFTLIQTTSKLCPQMDALMPMPVSAEHSDPMTTPL